MDKVEVVIIQSPAEDVLPWTGFEAQYRHDNPAAGPSADEDDGVSGGVGAALLPERERAVEAVGRLAGQALRDSAPADGALRAMNGAQRRRQLRAVAIGAAVVVAALIGWIVSSGSGGKERRPETTDALPVQGGAGLGDHRIAEAILLTAGEYAPGWEVVQESRVTRMVRDIAAPVAACSATLDAAFESDSRPAATGYRYFHLPKPVASFAEYVVVLGDDRAAQAMFDAVTDPGFLDGCVEGYLDALHPERGDPLFPFSRPSSDPPVMAGFGGDETALRTFQSTWLDGLGVVHGPQTVMSATIRVGRTVTVIETLGKDVFGRPAVTQAQFRHVVEHVATRATSALAGLTSPTVDTTPAVVPQTTKARSTAAGESSPLTVTALPGHKIWATAVSHTGLVALETSNGGSGGSHLTIVDSASEIAVDEFDIDAQPAALQYSVDTNLLVDGLGVIGRDGRVVHLTAPTISPSAFSGDGTRIVAATRAVGPAVGAHDLTIFDAHTGRALATLVGHHFSVAVARFSPDGTRVASGDEAGIVHVWDATGGASLREMHSDDAGAITALAFDPSGSTLLTTAASGAVQLWDTSSGMQRARLADPQSGRSAVLIANGERVLSSEPGGGLSVWRASDGALERRVGVGATGPVTPSSLSLDGSRVATADLDGGATVWDVASGARIFQAKPAAIDQAPILSDDGRMLVTVAGDTASIWKLPER